MDIEASPGGALADAVERVGDRWTLLLVAALLDGPARYSDLQSAVAGISPNILSQRLKHLEADGLVVAAPYQQRPQRFTYELTARGRELGDVVALLARWGGSGDAEDGGAGPRHDVCGTPVETRAWCPTCERPVDDETTDLHHL